MKKILKRIYMILILFLLYAPIATLIVLSFNSSKSRAKWGGFTLDWYSSLFQNNEIMEAFYTTLLVALLAAAIATLIGTLAAIGIHAMGKKARTIFTGITNIPMLNSEIVMGVSLMLLFIILRIRLGFSTILLAHITFDIPYVILNVLPKMKQTDRNVYEAALDLGATPFYAFRKTILPDIMPGISSGFLLSFTMSLDDFVITYFTKGPGVDTLSTKIYSEVRKGIKPEIYALSTILFISVMLLLLLINLAPSKESPKELEKDSRYLAKTGHRRIFTRHMVIGRLVPGLLIVVLAAGGIYYGGKTTAAGQNQVIVYNWGEYIDPDVLTQFEEETGIHVIYEEYETNEIMYPKIKAGAVAYDCVCPSDYMIQKMIDNDLLQRIDFDNVPNIKNIGEIYEKASQAFDPTNEYSIPYCWGTMGILYNTKMVDEPVTSWKILWDSKYKDSILMQDSVRDAFCVALKYLGCSANTTNMQELQEAKDLLIAQKPLVQAYVIDQVRDKMIGNEAALGVIYSGEAIYTARENPDLAYVVPDEGSNVWFDSWVIPKNAPHKENAEKFLNFLCRPDIALKNFEYITYSTPNVAAQQLIEDPDIRDSQVAFPDDATLERCETYSYLGADAEEIYNDLWNEVKSS